MRRSADLAGEDPRQRLDRIDRGLLVDEQGRAPVAARHQAREFRSSGRPSRQRDRHCRSVLHRCGAPPRSGNGLRSADARRARARTDRTPCNEQDRTNSPFNDHCSTLYSLRGCHAEARHPIPATSAATIATPITIKITPRHAAETRRGRHFLDRHDKTERRHPTAFITPTANIKSIIAQQQPRQCSPCRSPRPNTPRRSCRQLAKKNGNGRWHTRRQDCFSAEN